MQQVHADQLIHQPQPHRVIYKRSDPIILTSQQKQKVMHLRKGQLGPDDKFLIEFKCVGKFENAEINGMERRRSEGIIYAFPELSNFQVLRNFPSFD